MTNLEFSKGLRLIADFYEKHDGMEQFGCRVFCTNKEDFLTAFSILRDGGKVIKDLSDTSAYASVKVTRYFNDLELVVYCDKDNVCERIVTYRCPDSLLEEAMNAEEANA